MTISAIRLLLQDEMHQVDALILDRLQSPVTLIPTIAQYLINSGGKRLRPLLVLLVSRAFSAALFPEILTLAAVIEFIHTATLLHDDVVDDSRLRRGHETANAIWDNTASVLVGDFLLSRSFEMLVDIENVTLMGLLAKTTNTIAVGEVMQLEFCHNPAVTESEYLSVIQSKTAVLFSVAAQGAALLKNVSEHEQKMLSHYGLCLGMSFQLIDDALDYVSNTDDLGKNVGDDWREGKMTLPLIHALQHSKTAEKQWLAECIQDPDRISNQMQVLPQVLKIIESTESIAYTYALARKYRDEAKKSLLCLAPSPYCDALLALSDFAVSRTH